LSVSHSGIQHVHRNLALTPSRAASRSKNCNFSIPQICSAQMARNHRSCTPKVSTRPFAQDPRGKEVKDSRGKKRPADPETEAAVPDVGAAPEAGRRAEDPWIGAPGTAADDTVGAIAAVSF